MRGGTAAPHPTTFTATREATMTTNTPALAAEESPVLGFEHAGLFADTEASISAAYARVQAAAEGDSNDEEIAAYADLVETLLAALNVTTL